MKAGILAMLLLGTPLLGGVLVASAALAERAAPGRVADPAGQLILGLAPESALAEAYADIARSSAEAGPETPLARALSELVGLPLSDVRLNSGRAVSFEIDWAAAGAEGAAEDGTLRLVLADAVLADAVARRLDPVARDGTALTIDPARTAAALAETLARAEGVAYAQTATTVTVPPGFDR